MKKSTLMITTLLVVGLLGVSFAAAFGGGMMNRLSDEDRGELKENREALKEAIETGDYATWESLMLEQISKMEDQVNLETFEELQNRHASMDEFRAAMIALKESGDWDREAVMELKAEYGIEGKGFGRFGKGKGMGHGSPMINE